MYMNKIKNPNLLLAWIRTDSMFWKKGLDMKGVCMCQAIQEMREEERLIGERIGEKRGEKIGEARAEKRINELMKGLIQDGRMDDLKRSVNDRAYQEKLLAEYGFIS